MAKCLDLAKKGKGYVSPNPLVGCVIVAKNKIIGQGYHQSYGEKHAEVNAIEDVKNKSLLKESTLFVNLEPCAHFGKTGPCSELIIKHKIPKVVIGTLDTFSKVSGQGILKLKQAGTSVTLGVLEKKSRELNKRFFTFHEKKRPYIILKWAKSKDGFIAPKEQNKPFWMTSKKSKILTHKWRAEEDAILVGRITAEKDNPNLTVREIDADNPIRIVIDNNLKLCKNQKLFNSESKTLIFNTIKSKKDKLNHFIKLRHDYLIQDILKELYKLNIQSLIIEGGRETLHSFINSNLWDEARVFTTKKILANGIKTPKIQGKIILTEKIGNDKLDIIYNK